MLHKLKIVFDFTQVCGYHRMSCAY